MDTNKHESDWPNFDSCQSELTAKNAKGCISTLFLLYSLSPRGTSGERAGERGFSCVRATPSPLSIAAVAAPPSEGGEGADFTK